MSRRSRASRGRTAGAPPRRRGVASWALALAAALVLGCGGTVPSPTPSPTASGSGSGSGSDEARPAPRWSAPDPAPRRASPAPTEPVEVEVLTLAPGTSEYATARPELTVVRVRTEPPPRWDVGLTPVVRRAVEDPPRSAQDLARPPLPARDFQLVGRHVVDGGWLLSNPGSFDPPQPLVLGVVERQGPWIRVQVPVRPNGSTGWVHEAQVVVASTSRSVEVSLSQRRVRVLDDGVEVFSAPAGVGRPATPTPTGRFHVTDVVPSADPAGGYGPVALALDGYSEALDRFGGEDGELDGEGRAPVLAIHGTNRPDSVGAARSNGCPRLFDDDVVALAGLVRPGTPVSIVR